MYVGDIIVICEFVGCELIVLHDGQLRGLSLKHQKVALLLILSPSCQFTFVTSIFREESLFDTFNNITTSIPAIDMVL